MVGTLAKAWQDPNLWTGQRRRVVGLAASQIATDVLAAEGLAARNITRWLATQDRLAHDVAVTDDKAWRLRAGDLVVVDESAMADTAALARIHAFCQEADAKLLLVGDHRQLAAVGAAGGMELAATHGLRHELAETRRFSNAWEGPASLRLRDGDQTVLADYHKHGRLLDGGALEQTEQAAARAWLADTLAGRHALLIVDSNERAARLSGQLRTDLVRLGRVDDSHTVPLGLQGTFAGRGDLVQARRNAWELAAPGQRAPINREQYRVLDTQPDGGLIVAPVTGRTDGRELLGDRMTLPGRYVAQHVGLAYASTVHAAQGLTVDTCHTVATAATGVEALYVGMTRGRDTNTAYVVTRAVPITPDGAPTGQAIKAVHRSPQAVLAGTFDTADPLLSALAEATASATEAESVRTPAELFADAAELATAGRTARWLDEMVADGTLTDDQRIGLAAEDGAATLTTLLRRVELAGHDPHQILTDAIGRRSLDDARQLTNVIHRRITETTSIDPIGSTYTDWVPSVDDPQWATYLTTLAQAADERRAELGRQVADEAPQWAVEALGPVPVDDDARQEWKDAAANAAAHRELVGHDDPADALGPAPKPGRPRPTRRGGRPGARWGARRPTGPRPRCRPDNSASGSAPTTASKPGRRPTSPTSSPAPAKPRTSTAKTPPSAAPRPTPRPTPATTPPPYSANARPRTPRHWPPHWMLGPPSSNMPTRPARTGTPTPQRPAPPPTAPEPSCQSAPRPAQPVRTSIRR